MRESRPVRQFLEFRPHPLQLLTEPTRTVVPPNPAVRDGARLLYLGRSIKRVEGASTGYVYHAAPDRREIVVDRADLDSVLSLRAFVLAL